MTKINYQELLKKDLSKARYEHVWQTAQKAAELADRYQVNRTQAYTAGLLHDCAKDRTDQELKALLLPFAGELDALFWANPKLWHAPAGAILAAKQYQIRDTAVLAAITWHTTGKAALSPLEMIIYLADFLTTDAQGVDTEIVGRALDTSLEQAVYHTVQQVLEHLLAEQRVIHQSSWECWNYYVKYAN